MEKQCACLKARAVFLRVDHPPPFSVEASEGVESWRSWDRASWYISIVKPSRCKIFEFIEYHSTGFGRSFCPSSGAQDCTYSIKYMSYRLVDCLLASSQRTCMACTWCCVESWTPDDGRKDRPKHVEWYPINSKIVHVVGFTIEKRVEPYLYSLSGPLWPVLGCTFTFLLTYWLRKKRCYRKWLPD
jgi:hypothetical protein